jgi:putative transcriptional regulator
MPVRKLDPDGAVVHRLRLERGVTQERLAFKAHVTIATLSRIERGVTAPTVGTLRKIAPALGVSLAELVTAVEQEQH